MSNRMDRANSQIQKCIADIIQNKLNDPRLDKLIYVSEVNATPDFKYCKVKLAYDSEDKAEIQEVVAVLKKSEGFIKKNLVSMVRMPQVPKLIFEIDKGTAATIRINEILKTLDIPEVDEDDDDEI